MKHEESRFHFLFQDPLYLLYKNHLYNYQLRRRVIRRNLKGAERGRILELGCGTSPMLEARDRAVRADLSWEALRRLNNGGVACDAARLPFGGASFETVICSEVLEHVENDASVLDEISRVLKPGGRLLVTCPIHPELFGFDDRFVGHFRRYETEELTGSIRSRGFSPEKVEPVLGKMDKGVTELATRCFAAISTYMEARGARGQIGVRVLARLFFPFYLVVNYALLFLVGLQARLSPMDQGVTIFLRCRKLE